MKPSSKFDAIFEQKRERDEPNTRWSSHRISALSDGHLGVEKAVTLTTHLSRSIYRVRSMTKRK